jgi:outer membrane protein assembly factor BamB
MHVFARCFGNVSSFYNPRTPSSAVTSDKLNMKLEELVFIGIGGKVVALYRNSGQQAWLTKVGGDFVNVSVQADKVYAAAGGEIVCLDPFTGRELWRNPLRGCGLGLVTLAFSEGSSAVAAAAEKTRQDQAASGAAAAS